MTKTRYAADDAASIKARMEEIQQERLTHIMGQPLEIEKQVEAPADIAWSMFSVDAPD